MTPETFFTHASTAFTVVSFVVFVGILWWALSSRRTADFEAAANLPFDDDKNELSAQGAERNHG